MSDGRKQCQLAEKIEWIKNRKGGLGTGHEMKCPRHYCSTGQTITGHYISQCPISNFETE
jgi:hypothetical protein